jgi:hypothetical protein
LVTVKDKKRDEVERIAKVIALGDTSCPKCQAPYRRGKFKRPYFICACCGHRWSENPVTDALGRFLEELHGHHPWDWFFTGTFAKPISPAGAHYMFSRYLETIQRQMTREQIGKPACGTDYSAADGQPSILKFRVFTPYAFRADEYGPLGGRFHLHALIGNVKTVTRFCGQLLRQGDWGKPCCALHLWSCGYARIFPYEPSLGARFYLSKYVTKALGDYDLIGIDPGQPILRN